MPESPPDLRSSMARGSQKALALAGRVIRDIGDALIVLAQSARTRDHTLIALVEPLREAARRNFLFVIREKEIPVAVIILHRRAEAVEGPALSLTSISEWDAGPQLAVLELFSVRDDYDDVLREKAVAILTTFTAKPQG